MNCFIKRALLHEYTTLNGIQERLGYLNDEKIFKQKEVWLHSGRTNLVYWGYEYDPVYNLALVWIDYGTLWKW